MRFRRIASERSEWRSDNERWVLERAFAEGPRGGRPVRWHLYEVRDGRLTPIATEQRLRDIWRRLELEASRPGAGPVPASGEPQT